MIEYPGLTEPDSISTPKICVTRKYVKGVFAI